MYDLEHARLLLEKEDFTLVIVKKGEILSSSRKNGIFPLFEATSRLGKDLLGASIGDKIVGTAAAMLCIYAQVGSVYAVTISENAKSLIEQAGIELKYKHIVPNIQNSDGTGLCPFEKMAMNCQTPEELFITLQRKFSEK
jgi:hypothetical protein